MPAASTTRSPADWIFDKRRVAAVFASFATLIVFATFANRGGGPLEWSLLPITLALFWGVAVFDSFPRWPCYLMGTATPLVLNVVESDEEISMFLVVLVVAIAASSERDRTKTTAAITLIIVVFFVLGLTAIESFGWPNWTLGILFSWGFGELAFRFHTTIAELEHTRSLVADQAALRERRRIARDVHDLVGHSLSVVMLHVTGARHLVHKDPAEAERALEQAEAAGRESLAEIRRTVGLLRDDGDSSTSGLPSPELHDVRDLVDEFVVAGVDTDLVVTGDLDAIEGGPSLAGYRIVQEALTNASRHTAGARVDVTIDVGDESFDIVVRNTGGVTVESTRGPGFGLISMRERAKSVGGLLVAGPTPDGWTVEATLPTASKKVPTT